MNTCRPNSTRSVRQIMLLTVVSIAVSQTTNCFAQAVGGIYIDADGVLHRASLLSGQERLELLRKESFAIASSPALNATSQLRKISLRRLEETVEKLQKANQPLPVEVRYLAGLQRVQHVFFYPEAGDIVLAGPAEGWKQLVTGEVVGQQSNRPVLHLDDLVVALRYAFGQKNGAPFLGCSIDPTLEGQQRYVSFLNKLGGRIDRSRIRQILSGMSIAMGLQKITLYGVPHSSRFAVTMVAADYRLKRIAMGHDRSPARGVTNYLDLAAKRIRNPKALGKQHRWWFKAEYDAVLHSPDRLAFEFQGQGMKVVTGINLAGKSANSKKKPKPSPVANQFAKSFTKHLPEISAKIPVFAELQNLIGLAVAAELIAQQSQDHETSAAVGTTTSVASDQPDQTEKFWKPTYFLDAGSFTIRQYTVPSEVNSIANYRFVRGKYWMFSVSGGVEIRPDTLVGADLMQETTERRLLGTRAESRFPKQAERWWWD